MGMGIVAAAATAALIASVAGASAATAPAAPLDSTFRTVAHDTTIPAVGIAVRVDTWRISRPAAATPPVQLVSVIVPRSGAFARIAAVGRGGEAGALMRDSACPRAILTLNGGFYTRTAQRSAPLGLLRVAGLTRNPPSGRRYGGFLTIDNGRIDVIDRAQAADAQRARDALESSPIVTWNGADGIHGDDGVRFDRVGIGATASGAIIVVGSFGEDQETVTLTEFSRLSRAAARAQGDPIRKFLAMDGGPSAHIYLPRTGVLFGSRGPAYLPDIVCIGLP
jgi:Phosphodiester glycosidase